MEDFYLFLYSNSSRQYFRNNTPSNFTVQLPKPIELRGTWRVGLASIQMDAQVEVEEIKDLWFTYDYEKFLDRQNIIVRNGESWKDEDRLTLSKKDDKLEIDLKQNYALWFYYDNGLSRKFQNDKFLNENKRLRVTLHYQVDDKISFQLEELYASSPRIDLNPDTYLKDFKDNLPSGDTLDKNELTLGRPTVLRLSSLLADLLGFSQRIIKTGVYTLHPFSINELKKVDSIHVYSDLIKNQIVSHSFNPLLRNIPVQPYNVFNPIYYMDLNRNQFQNLQIELTSDKGLNLNLKTVTQIVLHFKKI